MFYTYVLYSPNKDRFYIGSTGDLIDRLDRHNRGASKSTKYGVPWELVYFQSFPTRAEAVRKELEIKSKKSAEYFRKGCCCSKGV
jgi:putative endonuclease